MNSTSKFLLAALAAAVALPAAAQVGISVNIGDPGYYGRVELEDAPPPRVVYKEPVVVERTTVVQQPLYLRVPPGHRQHWREHCREYDACGRPVYFVDDDWYQREYAPRWREHHPHG